MFNDLILRLTKRFYPKGRAFRIPTGGIAEKMHIALAINENEAYEATLSVLDSILPDNNNFTDEDASDWERRLGLIDGTGLPLATRKQAILRKMNHPGTIKARQHYLYLEKQLQDAGFNVYVHENRFLEVGFWVTRTPDEVAGVAVTGKAVHTFDGSYLEHGQVQHGGGFSDKIANSIDPAVDLLFNIGSNYRSTFFIGGQTLGSFAIVPPGRQDEFRQLVLKTKPAQTVAFPFINFKDFEPFTITVNTALAGSAADTFILPLEATSNYNFEVDWGDGNTDTITTWNQAELTHVYAVGGVYQIEIVGVFERIYFNNTATDKAKLVTIDQWGDVEWADMFGAFFGCSAMQGAWADTPNLNNVTDLTSMFRECTIFNYQINNFNFSNIKKLNGMFRSSGAFNQPLAGLDFSNASDIREMFRSASVFNQDLSALDFGSATNLNGMFRSAIAFNQAIGVLDFSSVTDMAVMFRDATAFNNGGSDNIKDLDTSSLTTVANMFQGTTSFDQPVTNWDVSLLANAGSFISGGAYSKANYDLLLTGWTGWVGGVPTKTVLSSVNLANDANYSLGSDADDARTYLIVTKTWSITDGGGV